MKKLLMITFITSILSAQNEQIPVKITSDIPYVMTKDSGQDIKIQRIQDTDNRLTDDYTKTSRACPPFCIQPTKVADGIKNVEEVELINFMKTKIPNKKGILIDARLKSWYEIETIPSAINIPFPVIKNASKAKAERIFKLLGMKIKADGTRDFSEAKEIVVFCNGVWCEQTKNFIEGMLKHNYPKEKLSYYRSGFQGWKLLGLTTVVHKEINKK
jgi:rhodanese-related sulfurtransferase